MKPIADLIRPTEISDVVGQKHLIGSGKILNKIIESKIVPNMIFYGPSGVGKTTVAGIISKITNKTLYKLNATRATTADIRGIIEDSQSFMASNGVLLYLDEIQYFNKKQQQSLLEFIENGKITLIASTTENPYFYIYNAILSRCSVIEFHELTYSDIFDSLRNNISKIEDEFGKKIKVSDEILNKIARVAGGDCRKAYNIFEILLISSMSSKKEIEITDKNLDEITAFSSGRYDKDSDMHYNLLSAFQKSIRGSDENAAIYYLARILSGGDLISACRRLLVIASEDIGLAYPMASVITKNLVDSAMQLGLPEARIPLAHATILLATSPKSNSAICAIDGALGDIKNGEFSDIPVHLKDSHYSGSEKLGHGIDYLYPHNFENNYTPQQYLPDALKDKKYYNFGKNKLEQKTKEYQNKIKGESK